MKYYEKPQVEVISNGMLEDIILTSGIRVNESNAGFEGDETW